MRIGLLTDADILLSVAEGGRDFRSFFVATGARGRIATVFKNKVNLKILVKMAGTLFYSVQCYRSVIL